MKNTEVIESILLETNKNSSKVADLISQITAASEEQSSASEQISKNIEAISNVTNESAAGTQQIARAAEDLNHLTNNLQNIISRFKISKNDNVNEKQEIILNN